MLVINQINTILVIKLLFLLMFYNLNMLGMSLFDRIPQKLMVDNHCPCQILKGKAMVPLSCSDKFHNVHYESEMILVAILLGISQSMHTLC
jgi:hypothetical protein